MKKIKLLTQITSIDEFKDYLFQHITKDYFDLYYYLYNEIPLANSVFFELFILYGSLIKIKL
jgi:hypothetical protein